MSRTPSPNPAAPAVAAVDAPLPSHPVAKLYSIGTAARLADVAIETVRIWERRYEILRPGRSEGGHRLYSDDDVDLLRGAKTLVDDGLRPSEVFRLGRERLIELARSKQQPPAADWGDAIDAVIDAGLRLDDNAVAALLDGALLNRSHDEVANGLWLPVMSRVGDLWERGQLPIAVEHFLQQHVSSRMQTALRATPSQAGPIALCACAPDDRHEVGLFAAALALKKNGYAVVVLGGDVPASELESAVVTSKAAVVVLSVTARLSRDASRTLPVALERAPLTSVPLILGGPCAVQLRALLHRDHQIVTTIASVVTAANDALKMPARR